MPKSSFSVAYKDPAHPDNYCAVDWSHWKKGRWIKSWKSVSGSTWHEDGVPDALAGAAILDKFGLKDSKDELFVALAFLSPASLVRFREGKGLPKIDIFSDTPGDREARAEEYK